ncbi:pseudoazurin [Chelatococcus sp. SYSU_G07232]|uniref:Pseudoazurin n=1 Tax=Chelatococcus albus TaxID=3047466 RepID=A0ABT7AFP9_9HYPH|nr:pseudoazurin [Chelatococcus sp. SYSU_G07232]MDJ1158208.1 pseudoazurin [Chelatococcus sp. SYSU_G07232]
MRTIALVGAALLAAAAGTAGAAEVQVKMLNKGAEGVMVFEPALVRVAPGDSVRFVATDKGHNAETIETMLPEGATPFAGKINEEIVVTFDKQGVYGYRCKPHYSMGMVGLVVVGTPTNEEQAKAATHPGKAKQVFATLFERLATVKAAAQ